MPGGIVLGHISLLVQGLGGVNKHAQVFAVGVGQVLVGAAIEVVDHGRGQGMIADGGGDGMGDKKAGADQAEEYDHSHCHHSDDAVEHLLACAAEPLLGAGGGRRYVRISQALTHFLFAGCAHVVHSSHLL